MPAVTFDYVSQHDIVKHGGVVNCAPGLPHASRLYVIHHAQAAGHPFYIGTAAHIRNRFRHRLDAVRELGFRNNEIMNVTIGIVRILVNGIPRTPGNLGIAVGIDVEHLLIRMHLTQGNGVRNMGKINPFINNLPNAINCTVLNNAMWLQFMPAAVNVAPGAIL
jgi:hypothetical protein